MSLNQFPHLQLLSKTLSTLEDDRWVCQCAAEASRYLSTYNNALEEKASRLNWLYFCRVLPSQALTVCLVGLLNCDSNLNFTGSKVSLVKQSSVCSGGIATVSVYTNTSRLPKLKRLCQRFQ